jgi:DNA-nicking Smr family endonuclease
MPDEDLGPDPGAPDADADGEALVLPLSREIDLHLFAVRERASVLAEYLLAASGAGFGEVRIIHGKGIGVQRDLVRRQLAASPLVADFADDPSPRGGKGATLARLASVRRPIPADPPL